jgi:CheY-like chemotaxis protein
MVSPAYESKCVAIVDDDAPMRQALMDPLDEGGCAARAFASGEEFLASGHAHECSCLIADIRMPGMTGLDLQARLSAEQKRSPSSLLLLTTTNAKSTRIHDPMQANTSLRSFVRGMVVGAIELQNSPTRLSSCPSQDGVCACGHGTWGTSFRRIDQPALQKARTLKHLRYERRFAEATGTGRAHLRELVAFAIADRPVAGRLTTARALSESLALSPCLPVSRFGF